MALGRDFELERGGVRAALEVGKHTASGGVSGSTLYLTNAGDLVLYSADAGWAVQMQIGEHVQEWQRWHTVKAEHVQQLIIAANPDEAAAFLAAVRDAIGTHEDQPGTTIEKALVDWLDAQGVPHERRENEDW